MTTYVLPDLPYGYDAFEPWCTAEIMELHHDKHHRTYVDKANEALEHLSSIDVKDAMGLAGAQRALTFNLSGHVLHSLFWESLSPTKEKPEGDLLAAIEESFGTFATMKGLLKATATAVQGSGWGALSWDPVGERLHVTAIHDHHQDHLAAAKPLAVIDVWEHAYYLQYRSDRAAWVEEATAHIAWTLVASRFAVAREHATV